MSLGSPRITVRIPQPLLDQVLAEIELHNSGPCNLPEDLSRFVVRSLRDRIAHRQRSRAKRRKPAPPADESWPSEIISLTDPTSPNP